jgi:hypothetical protein
MREECVGGSIITHKESGGERHPISNRIFLVDNIIITRQWTVKSSIEELSSLSSVKVVRSSLPSKEMKML